MRRRKREREYGVASWCAAAAKVALPFTLFYVWGGEVPAAAEEKSVPVSVFETLIKDLFNEDVREVHEMALASIGATRSFDSTAEITLLGAIGTAPQSVDRSRPLSLRWNGGAPPFHIELAAVGGTDRQILGAAERSLRLNLNSDPPGDDYTLTILGSNDVRLVLPLHFVNAAEVPVAPGIETVQDQETRELAESVWLLTRAPIRWRLEALSRLEFLARDYGNIVAQTILQPAASSEGQADH
jgi:hypothetical protein